MHHQRFPKITLDNSFVKCFSPIYYLQVFLGSSRVNIKNNVVTSITPVQKLYTFIWMICVTVSFSHFELHYYKEYHDRDTILHIACGAGTFVQYISYLSNIIHVRFTDNSSSSELYYTIKKIDDILSLQEYTNLKNSQYYWNILALVLIILPFESGFVCYVVATVEYPLLTVFCGLGLLISYIELLFLGSLIYYLTLRLKYLNKIMQYNFAVKHQGYAQSPLDNLNSDLLFSTEEDNNVNLDKFVLSLTEILKSYRGITEVFSFTVFNVAATLFTWALVVVESIVEGLHGQLRSEITIASTGLWIVYYFMLVFALVIVNDKFIQEVRQTKLHCIYATSYRVDGPYRNGAKNIIHAIHFMPPVFSVYGIFVLDKNLPFKLIGIITTNVVVLIQFTI